MLREPGATPDVAKTWLSFHKFHLEIVAHCAQFHDITPNINPALVW